MRLDSPSQDESSVIVRTSWRPGIGLLELGELVEKGCGLAVAVRVDERDLVRKLLLADVAEHATEDRDPDPAGDEHVVPVGVLGQEKAPLRLLDVDLGSDRQLGE